MTRESPDENTDATSLRSDIDHDLDEIQNLKNAMSRYAHDKMPQSMASRKRFVVHIGHGKTGTTSLQTTLYHQRHRLLPQGILYPDSGIPALPKPWQSYAHQLLCHNLDDPRIGLDEVQSNLTAIRGAAEQSGATCVIVSSENLCYAQRTIPQMFANTFPDFEFTVVYNVRRQDSLVPSSYFQSIKSGASLGESLLEYFGRNREGFRFCPRAEPWADTFGVSSVVSTVYNSGSRLNVVKAFFDAAKISAVLNDATAVVLANDKMGWDFAEVLQTVHQSNLPLQASARLINSLEELSSRLKVAGYRPCGVELPSGWLERIREEYQEDNEQFSRQYLDTSACDYFTFQTNS
jgi:hypothetical protein